MINYGLFIFDINSFISSLSVTFYQIYHSIHCVFLLFLFAVFFISTAIFNFWVLFHTLKFANHTFFPFSYYVNVVFRFVCLLIAVLHAWLVSSYMHLLVYSFCCICNTTFRIGFYTLLLVIVVLHIFFICTFKLQFFRYFTFVTWIFRF